MRHARDCERGGTKDKCFKFTKVKTMFRHQTSDLHQFQAAYTFRSASTALGISSEGLTNSK